MRVFVELFGAETVLLMTFFYQLNVEKNVKLIQPQERLSVTVCIFQ